LAAPWACGRRHTFDTSGSGDQGYGQLQFETCILKPDSQGVFMSFLRLLERRLGCLVPAVVLVACGGAEPDPVAPARQAALARPLSAGAAAVAPAAQAGLHVDAALLMDWAEFRFKALFPPTELRAPLEYEGRNFSVREYRGEWGSRYLGVTDKGEIYGLGDYTGNQLLSFGNIADWVSLVQSDRCGVDPELDPAACINPAPAGPLNACVLGAAKALTAGNRTIASYVVSGSYTGSYATDSVVEGVALFGGKEAIAVRTTSRVSVTSKSGAEDEVSEMLSWEQVGDDGLRMVLALEGRRLAGGPTSVSGPSPSLLGNYTRTFRPAQSNLEFTLPPGQALTRVATNATALAAEDGPTTARTTYLFEGQETLVVRGVSYQTCRYLQTPEDAGKGVTRVWHLLGHGLPVAIQTTRTTPSGVIETTLKELSSATVNGVGI
jgi:hypothetical protein